MVVYIEYVLIDNFVMDYLLLKATFTLLKKEYKKGRLFFCAFLGAIIALTFPIVEISPVLLTLLKIISGLLLVLLARAYRTAKEYFLSAITFFILTFSLGGILIGIFSIFGVKEIGEVLIATIFIPAYVLLSGFVKGIKFIVKRKTFYPFLVKCEIVFRENKTEFIGFLDTGNGLYLKDEPIVVIGRRAFLKLIDKEFPKMEYVEYKTVMGESKMPTFTVDKLLIYLTEEPNIIYNARVGIARHGEKDDYDLILHPALIGENYAKSFENQTKKTS